MVIWIFRQELNNVINKRMKRLIQYLFLIYF